MRYQEVLNEAAVIDFRKPDKTYQPPWGGPPRPFTTCFVLGKTQTLIYNLEDVGNERQWEIDRTIAKLVPNEWQSWSISAHRPVFRLQNGTLIMVRQRTYERKGGDASRYSEEVISAAQQFLKRRLVAPDTEMYLQTVEFAHPIGTVAEVAAHTEQHALILYHGTTSGRALTILREGLRPLASDAEHRQWREKTSPEYRETAVYLTASPQLAAIYATRAATNARKRHERGQKPAVLQVTIDPPLFDHMRADDDYLRAMGKNAQDWRHSLSFYGQVAVVSTIPADHIALTGIRVKNRNASPPS